MTHDPLQAYAMQTYATLGGYPGVTGQFGLPTQPLQTLGIQPGISPLLQGGGISPLQNVPYQNPLLQNPILAGLQNPILAGLQNPLLQNPLQQLQQNPLQQLQQNPLLQHAIHAQIQAHIAQQVAQQVAQQLAAQQVAQQLAVQQLGAQPFGGHSPQISPCGQTGSPYGQIGAQFGQGVNPWAQAMSPLAPQTWVGQGGQVGGYGQIHPLAHLAGRGQYVPGIAPWAGI
jgi:hypothetical protein